MLIDGKCHCGNISFKLDWKASGNEIQVRACGCSFCVKHGGVWTSHAGSKLEVAVRDPARLSRYRFGTGTAEFHLCTQCGVVPVVTSAIAGRVYAVVNVNTFENVEPSRLVRSSTNFDGEGVDDRLARRERNWIADVLISGE